MQLSKGVLRPRGKGGEEGGERGTIIHLHSSPPAMKSQKLQRLLV